MNLPSSEGNWHRALIVGSGEDVPATPPLFLPTSYVIAADGGARHLLRWKQLPHLVVGDLDSLLEEDRVYLRAQGVDFLVFPKDKDETDLELACKVVTDLGILEVHLYGVWGSRMSHSLAAMEVLYAFTEQGGRGEIITSKARSVLLRDTLYEKLPKKSLVSLLPVTEKVLGVTTTGLHYKLTDAILSRRSSLGVSNVVTEDYVGVTVKEGVLCVIMELETA